MRITTLIENLVYQKKLVAEHGFSLLIEDDKKILFDTGQTSNFINNAKELNIDISDIDTVVISHGHYDHTGGLEHFLNHNDKAKIYLKRNALIPKFRKGNYIGFPKGLDISEDRMEFVTNPIKISENVILVPKIKTYYSHDQHKAHFTIKEEGIFSQDEFTDELFLIINQDEALSVISSCSHNGITNILETAKELYKKPIKMVLGGFHTKNDVSDSSVKHIIKYFNNNEISEIYVSHCTGIESFVELKNKLSGNVFYNFTGNIINI